MLADARAVPEGTELETDICIVGARPAGITLARELAGGAGRVVVLESGGFALDPHTQALAQGDNIGLPYFPLFAAHLRQVGGTSNHWGGYCRPFDEIDFEPREGVRRSGWPIRKAELERYYARASSICSLTSGEWEVAAWEKRDENPAFPLSGRRVTSRVVQVVPDDKRSFGVNFRDEIARAAGVTAYLHGKVTEIDSDEAGRATRVSVVKVLFDENARDWPADLAGGWHHMGTTRMSDDPKSGVVDRNCGVHGMPNLYVAGSSVFPTAGSGTPTLLIVSLALGSPTT